MTSVLMSRLYPALSRTLLSTQCRVISVSSCRNQQAAKIKSAAEAKAKPAAKSNSSEENEGKQDSTRPLVAAAESPSAAKDENLVFQERSAPFPPPPAEGSPQIYSPKILRLIDEIANLTLIEVADLNKALKKKLNLPDTPMLTASMAMPAAAAKEEDDDAAPAVAAAKTKFSVKLTKIDDSKKIATIKEIKSILPNLNLVQAKKFVEMLPQVVKGDLLKDEADKLVSQLTALGAVCEVD